MILVKRCADFSIVHHFVHLTLKLVLVHFILQQLVKLLLVNELLCFRHLFHHFNYRPSKIKLSVLISGAAGGMIGVMGSATVLVLSITRIIVVHIRHIGLAYLLALFLGALIHLKLPWLQNSFFSDAMRDIYRQEMVGQLIKLFNAFYVSSYDSLLFFKYSDITIYLHVSKLLVMEVSESGRNLIFSFVIEENVKCARVIINLKLSPHRFFYPSEDSST